MMFIDASALVAVLSAEPEASRVAAAIARASLPITSSVAVLEAGLALARPDKFDLPLNVVEVMLSEFLDEHRIDIVELPPARETTRLVFDAAHRYRHGRKGLNIGDCYHYAVAKARGVPILATAQEFRQTDLQVVD
jgi:ribonuclease VapC